MLALWLSTAAWSAEMLAPPGVLELLPPGDVVGDGSTAVSLHLLALDAEGQPVTGLELKPKASTGTLAACSETGNGLYTCPWTPPRATAPTKATFRLKGKNEAKQKLQATASVGVRPVPIGGVRVAVDPPTLLLGERDTATVKVSFDGRVPAADDLMIRTSAGTVENVTFMGDGQFTALYKAPAEKQPALALITLSDRADPARVYGAVAIPLSARADYPVQSAPNASVILKVGGRDFGPVQASSEGKARIPLVIPPGVEDAKLVTVGTGGTTESAIALDLPPSRRVQILPVHAGLPADPALTVPVRVAVYRPDGSPDPAAGLTLSSSLGTVSLPRHEGDGIYVADLTPSPVNAHTEVLLTASVDGSDVHADEVMVRFTPVRPDTLALTAVPEALLGDEAELEVVARVSAGGTPLEGRSIRLNVTGGKLDGAIADEGGGTYRAKIATSGRSDVEVLGTVAADPTGNPPRDILVVPLRDRIVADGLSSVMLTVVTVDEYGYPVSGVPVTLKVLTGGGSIPETVTTDASGLGQVFYTSSRTPGVARVRAEAAGFGAEVAVLQTAEGMTAPPLPRSGSAASAALEAAWKGTLSELHVVRGR